MKQSVRVSAAAGSIFAPLMWPQLQGEVIAEAFCSEGEWRQAWVVKARRGWID